MIERLHGQWGIPGQVSVTAGKNGMPKVVLAHSSGAGAEVYLHGGHVTSWKNSVGAEMLFLSRESHFAPDKPIRGGIPLCFPQFGPGALPQHGFARTSPWSLVDTRVLPSGAVAATLRLEETPATLAMWPHRFRLDLDVQVDLHTLTLALAAANTGDDAFDFQAVYHTYFGVADIRQAAVQGLDQVTFIDSLRSNIRETETRAHIHVDAEIDRIYENAPDLLYLHDEGAGRAIVIEKSGMPDVTVWNPWVAKSQRMPDFGGDEYQRMLCVETGVMVTAAVLQPGEEWKGETILRAERA